MGPLGAVKKLVEPDSLTLAEVTGADIEVVTRFQRFEQSKEVIESFPDSWFFFFHSECTTPVRIRVGTETGPQSLTIGDGTGLLLPPYALVHWQLPPGMLMWQAYRARRPLPSALAGTPLCIPWKIEEQSESLMLSAEKLMDTLMTLLPSGQVAEVAHSSSLLARQLKEQIELNYRESVRLEELCRHLRTSLSNASHAFSKCFGLSPIAYRNQLRLHQAVLLMAIDDHAVTDACYESGFEDFSRFYRNFRTHLGVKPSAYQQRKLLGKVKSKSMCDIIMRH